MRIWYYLLWLCLSLAVSVGGGFALWQTWLQVKAQQGIEVLDWTGFKLSLEGVQLEHLVWQQHSPEGTELHIETQGLSLRWSNLVPLAIPNYQIELKRLKVRYQNNNPSGLETPVEAPNLPSWSSIQDSLAWLPQQLSIEHFDLELPCATLELCHEQGRLSWKQADTQALATQLDLYLYRDPHQTHIALQTKATAQQQLEVSLKLALDEQSRLESQQQLLFTPSDLRWSGALHLSQLPEAPWLLDWLSDWLSYQPAVPPQAMTDIRLGASWSFDSLGHSEQSPTGNIRLALNSPTPWPIPQLGTLQGNLDLALELRAQLWIPSQLSADLTLQPDPSHLERWPTELHPGHIRLKVLPRTTEAKDQSLPLNLSLTTQGSPRLNVKLPQLQLYTHPLRLDFGPQAHLEFKVPRLNVDQVQLNNLHISSAFSGQWTPEQLDIQLADGSFFNADRISATDYQLQLDQLRLKLNQTKFSLPKAQSFSLYTQVQSRLEQLQHPELKTQGWDWQGELKGTALQQQLTGQLSNDSRLRLATQLSRQQDAALELKTQLQSLKLQPASNALAQTLKHWPETLELHQGEIGLEGQITIPAQKDPEASVKIQLHNLAGEFNRSELQGLEAHLTLELYRQQMSAEIHQLRVQHLNPGFPLGPLSLSGRYWAYLDQPSRGLVSWQHAQLEAFGAKIWAPASRIDLASQRQALNLHLRGLDIQKLFAAYPAQGLQGTGLIDGNFELQHSPKGFSIDKGSLSARSPGILQLRSPQIQAMGATNPATRVVTQALDNFHYQHLSSDIHYTTQGWLQLGLRLQGRNPELEQGRPIHFSIQLEENIPTLLTSLQLSDRVSERIQQRVQQQLKNNPTPATPTGD